MKSANEDKNHYFPAYFKDWSAIRDAVTSEQGWVLFLACLDYAQTGTKINTEDPVVSAFFRLLAGGIDRSFATVKRKSLQGRYAQYCRACKRNKNEPLSLDEWIAVFDATNQNLANSHDSKLMNADDHDSMQEYSEPCDTIQSQSQSNQNQNQNPIQSEPKSNQSSHALRKKEDHDLPKTEEEEFEDKRNAAIKKIDDFIG